MDETMEQKMRRIPTGTAPHVDWCADYAHSLMGIVRGPWYRRWWQHGKRMELLAEAQVYATLATRR